MGIVEFIAVVFSLLCVLFAIRRNILNWPAGIIGVSAYLVLFFNEKLYADATLQIFFLAQGIYGWIYWQHSKRKDHDILISSLSSTQRAIHVLAILAITILWGMTLQYYTDASVPFVDALAATTSFAANWLMARKKIENWILWILADIIYVGLFWYKELYLSCGIYIVFLAMALAGLLEWRRKSLSVGSH